MRTILSFLLLLAFLGHADAQGRRIERIDIVETGIFRAEVAGTERAPGTATGNRKLLEDIRLVRETTTIEAKAGLHFGFRYRVVGKPRKGQVNLTAVLLYPQPGVKNPRTGNTIVRGEHTLTADINAVNYRGYIFEEDWEIVPGTWTFELWDGERKLASQSFEVVKP